MKKAELVSIILTTKNEEENITGFLKSVKHQTYKNIEIIVVDNASSDRTKKIARLFTKKVYDLGPERSVQRNFGAKIAKGEYLAFLDADMELGRGVIEDCVDTIKKEGLKTLTIPEKTVGKSFIAKVRNFEREMYMGEFSFEVPRVFEKKAFWEFGGYDPKLTGPEDYDLPYRLSKKYKIARSSKYIFHHEEKLNLIKLLRKKYYYAKNGAFYATKHPKMVWVQGTILFRKVYLKNWKKFVKNPFLGISFIFVRFLEMCFAIAGFVSAVGTSGLIKTLVESIKHEE